jgi:hypothetical protein
MSLEVSMSNFYDLDNGSTVLYSDWNKMVQNSFEKYFYIPLGTLMLLIK